MNRFVKVQVLVIALYGFTVCTVCALTPVDLCDDQEFNQNVTVVGCKEPPCLLRKQTSKKFVINFVPDRDIDEVYNSVHAKIAGLPVPFVGVHGTNACEYIFDTDLEQKVGCPLKKDVPVVFKYQVNVYDIYPNIETIVHWGLTGSDEKDVMCFEVPVSIVENQQ